LHRGSWMRLGRLGLGLIVLTGCTLAGGPDGGEDPLDRFPGAQVEGSADGVPLLVTGDLGQATADGGKLDDSDAAAVLPELLREIAPVFRLRPTDLRLVRVTSDRDGTLHARYQQMQFGFDVDGAELLLHIDPRGKVYAAGGTARGGITPSMKTAVDAEEARARASAASGLDVLGAPELGFLLDGARRVRLVWEALAAGERDGLPGRERIFIDARTGAVAATFDLIHEARDRRVTSSDNASLTSGRVTVTEGGAPPAGDVTAVTLYDHLGTVYDCYQTLFGRDSWDGKGAKIDAYVHYGISYVNAFWDGEHLVFGDGNGDASGPFGDALDVVGHELTHAVVEKTAGLRYEGESGAINEAMADIFGAVCETWSRGDQVGPATWLLGEDAWTPGKPDDALRYMDDPTRDEGSKDFYPDRYVGFDDNGGVHWNSGIANLAFKLLVTGGSHPRGLTAVEVPALGLDDTRRIFYRALTAYLSSASQFVDLRLATQLAASELLGPDARDAVGLAWKAVGVDVDPEPLPAGEALPSGATRTLTEKDLENPRLYIVEVPEGAGRLVVETRGPGDVDVLVEREGRPTPQRADHQAISPSADEMIVVMKPRAGRYGVLVTGYTPEGGTVTVRATVDDGTASAVLRPGRWAQVTARAGDEIVLGIPIPANAPVLLVELGEGHERAAITVGGKDAGGPEGPTALQVATPLEGEVKLRLRALADGVVELRASALTGRALAEGQTDVIDGNEGPSALYVLDVPEGAGSLEIRNDVTFGAAMVLVSRGEVPTRDSFHFRMPSSGVGVIGAPMPGRYFVSVLGLYEFESTISAHAGAATESVSVKTRQTASLALPPGVERRFTLERAPFATGTLRVSGDLEVLVRKDAPPTAALHDASTIGQTDAVKTIPISDQTGTIHVLARAPQGGNGELSVSLTAPRALRKGIGAFLTTPRGGSKLLMYTPSTPGASVTVKLSGGQGEADLFVKQGGLPTSTSFDAGSSAPGTADQVTLTANGPLYILVTAPSDHALVGVTASE
jgi:Zn-dependent metalloprotease